jgi:hypothetical protein
MDSIKTIKLQLSQPHHWTDRSASTWSHAYKNARCVRQNPAKLIPEVLSMDAHLVSLGLAQAAPKKPIAPKAFQTTPHQSQNANAQKQGNTKPAKPVPAKHSSHPAKPTTKPEGPNPKPDLNVGGKKRQRQQDEVSKHSDQSATKKPKAEAVPTPTKQKQLPPSTKANKPTSGQKSKIRMAMEKHLMGGHFRYLNELLYTSPSSNAFEEFQSQPELFDDYHQGFRAQVEKWPSNPLAKFIDFIDQFPAVEGSNAVVVADFGCGDAMIGQTFAKKKKNQAESRVVVHSFDLVAKSSIVTACDMAHVSVLSLSLSR